MLSKAATIIILSFLFINDCISQALQFKCFTKSACGDSIKILNKYLLKGIDTAYYSSKGVCFVSKPGRYIFYSEQANTGVEPLVFNFSSLASQIQYDTIQIPVLYSVLVVRYGKHSNLKTGDWVYCQTKAEGIKTDYYINGQKKIEGLFKNGRPVGALKYFSYNGNLIHIDYFNKRGKKKRSSQ